MSHAARWESRRQDERIAVNADQAELDAIRNASSNMEAGTFDDRVAGAMDDYDVPDPRGVASWAAEDIKVDSATSDIGLEVQRRKQLLGSMYPFNTDGNRITYRQSDTLVYEFCLAVSLAKSLSVGDYASLPVAFERLVRDALICFLGPGADGVRTGWPSDEHEDRPTGFRDVMHILHGKTGEFCWRPMPGLPQNPSHIDTKDEGLDVVVWKEVPDTRAGKLILLGQCACGGNYGSKLNDIEANLATLSRWMNPVCWAPPTRVFCTPRHISNEFEFQRINQVAGLTLDRIRLTLLAEQQENRAVIASRTKVPFERLIRLVVDGFAVVSPKHGQPTRTTAAEPHFQSPGTAEEQRRRQTTKDTEIPEEQHTQGS